MFNKKYSLFEVSRVFVDDGVKYFNNSDIPINDMYDIFCYAVGEVIGIQVDAKDIRIIIHGKNLKNMMVKNNLPDWERVDLVYKLNVLLVSVWCFRVFRELNNEEEIINYGREFSSKV